MKDTMEIFVEHLVEFLLEQQMNRIEWKQKRCL